MSEAPTDRAQAEKPRSHDRLFLESGNRHRCVRCRGEQGEPRVMCHHCGRSYCAACQPRRPALFPPWLFKHQDLKGLEARGQRQRFFEPTLEAMHCTYCWHPTPRLDRWFLLHGVLTLLGIGLLALLAFPPLWVLLLGLLYFFFMALLGYAWSHLDHRLLQARFFPLDAGPVRLVIRERWEADSALDADGYTETPRSEGPHGTLKATIPLHPAMNRELDDFARAHGLSEAQLEAVPASAGFVVLEEVMRLRRPTPPWPRRGARRWELGAPLPQWALLWSGKGESSHDLHFDYDVDWTIPRLGFRMAFPVQVQAHLPADSGRSIVELSFQPMGPVQGMQPLLSYVSLAMEEDDLEFQPLLLSGRPLRRESSALEVADLARGDDGAAHLQLRFTRPLPSEGEMWLVGEVRLLSTKPFSGVKVAAFYNPLGRRDESALYDALSEARLHFRLNLASLPYQATSVATDSFLLRGATTVEQGDAIVRAVGRASRLVQLHESDIESIGAAHNGQSHLPPTREMVGHWQKGDSEPFTPATFRVNLVPTEGGIHVRIHAEALIAEPETPQGQRAMSIVAQVAELVRRAVRDSPASPGPARSDRSLLDRL